jgi:hypothetical protein
MSLYRVKLLRDEKKADPMRKNETLLKDLLTVIPTLRKHKLDSEITTKIRQLRDGRQAKCYTLELSRPFKTYDKDGKVVKELRVTAPLPRSSNKIEVLRNLKGNIISQIQTMRKEQRAPIEDYTFSEGITTKKQNDIYLSDNVFQQVAVKRVRTNMTRDKMPVTDDNHIGIEIEMASKLTTDALCNALFEAGLGKNVCVKTDGSIRTYRDFPHNHEITLLCKDDNYKDKIIALCSVLNKDKQSKVNKTCGLHVHLDVRARDKHKVFANMLNIQHFLYAANPAFRKIGEYSYPINTTRWGQDRQHYAGINTQEHHNTIEIRMHSATTNAKKIVNWVTLLLAAADGTAVVKSDDIRKSGLALSDSLFKYFEARFAKFAKQHEKTGNGGYEFLNKVSIPSSTEAADEDEQSEVERIDEAEREQPRIDRRSARLDRPVMASVIDEDETI